MTTQPTYKWKCEPHAEAIVQEILDVALQSNSAIAELEKNLIDHTSSRLFDWLDHVITRNSLEIEKKLNDAGFIIETTSAVYHVYHHPGAQLPKVVVYDDEHVEAGIAVSVESISDFLLVRGMTGWVEGTPYSSYRRCLISAESNIPLWVVERRSSLSLEPIYSEDECLAKYLDAKERWETRPRSLVDDDESFSRTLHIAQEIVHNLGADLAAWIVLEVERKYWQVRNLAGQLQKGRQDRLGMGWANHDHHTFRSSRKHFHQLVRLFEILGFHCRERYYTGAEAGWGAQIMENSRAKLVVFLDVDLGPHEVEIDFAHHQLPELNQLGTIGLWCALHGDSILGAGMHHLEAQFLFEELTTELHRVGVAMMQPFSNFPYLKQAFTQGEIWHVPKERLQKLSEEGKITKEQLLKFTEQGAIGSHMENLQRREGYKGFNQKNVSVIIKETDPRKNL